MLKDIIKKDSYNKSIDTYYYNPYLVDIIFPKGPTFLTIAKSDYGNPIVQMFRKTSSNGLSPLEVLIKKILQACGGVNLGDIIISINNDDLTDLFFNDILKKFKKASRPMTLRFAKPEEDPKLYEQIDECPGKEIEWKTDYISF